MTTLSTATLTAARRSSKSDLAIESGVILQDAITGRQYRVERLLGRGGFGAAYLGLRLFSGVNFPKTCVLKVTIDAPAWHREAYFGHLLQHVPELVRIYDSFVWAPLGMGRKPLYCLVSEHMEQGDLRNYFARNPSPWAEAKARREVLRLLRAVATIHTSGAVHRDITPGNVFVTASGALKLGDFGIATHRAGRKDAPADAFTRKFAPNAILDGAKAWRQADDVHQLGQLYASLLSGVVTRKIKAAEVKEFACSAHTKSVLQRCIGERRKCFSSAAEMLEALEGKAAPLLEAPRVSSLAGKHVVFTGELSIPRAEAKKFARRAGATIENQVTQATDVVIVGEQSPHWKAEQKGQKLLDVDREAERGHRIALLKEARFRALVKPPAK